MLRILKDNIIEDNEHYNDFFGNIGDAFVDAISWIFEEKSLRGAKNKYCIPNTFDTPKFMSCVLEAINAAKGKQATRNLKDFANKIQTGYEGDTFWPIGHWEMNIVKSGLFDSLEISWVEKDFVNAIFWCAGIYFNLKEEVEKDKSVHDARIFLQEFLKDRLCSENTLQKRNKEYDNHFLTKQIEPTIQKFYSVYRQEQLTFSCEIIDGLPRQTFPDEYVRELETTIKELKIQIENTSNRETRPSAREFMAICHKYGLQGQTQYETEIILSILSGYSPTTFHGFWNDFVNEKQISKDTMEKIEQKIEEKKKKYPHK